MKLHDLLNEQIDIITIGKLFQNTFDYDGEYTINPNTGEITCSSITDRTKLASVSYTQLPVKFDKVAAGFSISTIGLETLKNCPKIVGGYFNCYNNNLTNLIGGPTEVYGEYSCYGNPLTSLEGLPRLIGKHITLSYNENLPLLRLLFVDGPLEIELYHNGFDARKIGQIEEILYNNIGKKQKGALLAAAELSKIGCKGNARL